MTKRVTILLANGFEEIEAITPIDVLRRAGASVCIMSIEDKKNVQGAHHISVEADTLFDSELIMASDMIVLPGGMPGTKNLMAHRGLSALLPLFNETGRYLAAICAAPTILGKLKLLEGRSATCFPGFENQLLNAKLSNRPVVVDKNIITARGAGVSLEFSLKLVNILFGEDTFKALYSKMQCHYIC